MVLPETRLLQAAIILAEELNFSRAAERLRIDQSTLSKRIVELEGQLDVHLFDRNHQKVELTDAGKRFVEEARQAMAHVERAMVSAKAVFGDADEILRIGRSSGTDPWLISMILAVHLPFHPGLRIQWSSNFSHEIAREVIVGTLDLALTTGLPENPQLTCLKMNEDPIYIAMSRSDRLATHREVRLRNMHNRNWVLFSRHVSPYMYDTLQHEASKAGVGSSELHHITVPDEAVPLILDRGGLAFLTKTGAWRIAWEGITIRPLAEENLRLVTCLTARADSKSPLVNDFVKAAARKVESLRRPVQTQLPLSA